jgi:hypothetical protein
MEDSLQAREELQAIPPVPVQAPAKPTSETIPEAGEFAPVSKMGFSGTSSWPNMVEKTSHVAATINSAMSDFVNLLAFAG